MNKKIIIIDDDIHIRSLLEQTLEEFEDEGIEILSAGNGQEGLELIKKTVPQIVFLDIMMPKMNGYQVCEQVKKDPNLKSIHIILLTAKGQKIDKEQGEESGANEYMTKPFDPDLIVKRVKELLNK